MKAVSVIAVTDASRRVLEALRLLSGFAVILILFAVLATGVVDSGAAEAPTPRSPGSSPNRVGSVDSGTAYPPTTVFYLVDSESQLDEIAASEAAIWEATSTTGQADTNRRHHVLFARTAEEEAAAAAFIAESIRASKFSPIVSVVDVRNPTPAGQARTKCCSTQRCAADGEIYRRCMTPHK
jgi:hypothetical protein